MACERNCQPRTLSARGLGVRLAVVDVRFWRTNCYVVSGIETMCSSERAVRTFGTWFQAQVLTERFGRSGLCRRPALNTLGENACERSEWQMSHT